MLGKCLSLRMKTGVKERAKNKQPNVINYFLHVPKEQKLKRNKCYHSLISNS